MKRSAQNGARLLHPSEAHRGLQIAECTVSRNRETAERAVVLLAGAERADAAEIAEIRVAALTAGGQTPRADCVPDSDRCIAGFRKSAIACCIAGDQECGTILSLQLANQPLRTFGKAEGCLRIRSDFQCNSRG